MRFKKRTARFFVGETGSADRDGGVGVLFLTAESSRAGKLPNSGGGWNGAD